MRIVYSENIKKSPYIEIGDLVEYRGFGDVRTCLVVDSGIAINENETAYTYKISLLNINTLTIDEQFTEIKDGNLDECVLLAKGKDISLSIAK